jgi:hypothetical protein
MTESESNSPDSPPPDPSGIEEPHDVLAAEEFGIGTRDERLPPDPSGIKEPHDVLAAEEFAMPAPDPIESSGGRLVADPRVLVPLMLLLLLVLAGLRRRAG